MLKRNYEDAPAGIKALPLDERGYPVPHFVDKTGSKIDFRIMSYATWVDCLNRQRCWITGEKMGVHKTFVVGPMCGINRTSAEPPCKKVNALYAVEICPFLAIPKMVRNENDLEGADDGPGIAIKRNPGVTLLWTTRNFKLFQPDGPKGKYLIEMGEPSEVLWFCEGRPATRKEALDSIESGMPILEEVATQDGDMEALNAAKARFYNYLPAE